ncbi:hypothetical protein INT45_007152 [Circinella minor]|uniref:Uncharacterized protein n=1 Tax=Circinella minor TaxID=1195481 RepID=A0A8H7S565_9FUNG|nr:hypothetical protein INT45_007152 [Circinella minor]
MRTSRGLRITSLIVVSPVILILISLVVILAMAIQSQVKAWYFTAVSSTLPQHQPFFSEPSTTSLQQQQFINARSISRLASTAFVFSYNHPTTQLSASHQHIDNNSSSNRLDSPKSTIVTTTTTTRRLLPRLKRLLPSSTWIGVLAVFAFITFQKVPFQQPLKSIASCISSPTDHETLNVIIDHQTKLASTRPSSSTHSKRRKKTKRTQTFAVTANTSAAIRQSNKLTHVSASAAHHAAQTQQQQTTTDQMRCTEGATTITPVLLQEQEQQQPPSTNLELHDDQLSIESSDDDDHKWINVSDKKKKRSSSIKSEVADAVISTTHSEDDNSSTTTTTTSTIITDTILTDSISCTTEENSLMTEEQQSIKDDDYDDDITTEDEVESITKTPVMENNKPRIQSWYSPFSTGLDLDIMPKGSDLLLNKPLGPPMNGDLFFRHRQLDQWRSQQEYPLMQRRAEPFTFFDQHY